MPTDPVPALLDIAKATPDPRAVANWLNAYLGTRPHEAKVAALTKLEQAFNARAGNDTETKAVGLILRIVRRALEDLAGGDRARKGRK